jgi:hypothetical protein
MITATFYSFDPVHGGNLWLTWGRSVGDTVDYKTCGHFCRAGSLELVCCLCGVPISVVCNICALG